MEWFQGILQGNFSVLFFSAVFAIILIAYWLLLKIISKYIRKTKNALDDIILRLLKTPALLIICWLFFRFVSGRLIDVYYISYLNHFSTIVLILLIAWIFIKLNHIATHYFQHKLDFNIENNLDARRRLTQINVFQKIINSLIIILAISISLLTFDKARAIGISILTSAGIAGIMVGLAAQKSLSMIFAGIQIAITQPIRLDDVVIVEGEWGRIEEITLTYVVVNIWDERRLILPVNYFLEKPFQNWTRNSSEILGTVFLYVDYNFPVERIREMLTEILKDNKDWDQRVVNVQVTNLDEKGKEIRILVSSKDASKNWDLRTYIREHLIDQINTEMPEVFIRHRIQID